MKYNEKLLLKLLQAGLGSKTELAAVDVDEELLLDLYKLSAQQTVRGIVLDGVLETFEGRITKSKTLLKWYTVVLNIEATNKLLNEVAGDVSRRFVDEGLHPVIAKGQVVALDYPNPLHRECGDIDFYFLPREGMFAVELMKRWGYRVIDESPRDVSFECNGVTIEIHPYMVHSVHLEDEKLAQSIQCWFEQQCVDYCQTIKLYNTEKEVCAPSVILNVVYEFYHLWMHFVRGEGVGLRQICDWRMTLHNFYGKYDVDELYDLLGRFRLRRQWVAFGGILVDYLGLPAEEMPFYKKSYKSRKILKVIFRDGNFGRNKVKRKSPTTKFGRLVNRINEILSRYMTLFAIFPVVSLRFLPSIKSVNNILRKK